MRFPKGPKNNQQFSQLPDAPHFQVWQPILRATYVNAYSTTDNHGRLDMSDSDAPKKPSPEERKAALRKICEIGPDRYDPSFGKLRGTARSHGDLTAPVDEDWDADSDAASIPE